MAGEGSRFGSHLPKQFHNLGDQRVYQHTLRRFFEADLFDEILLVCSSEWESLVRSELTASTNVRLVIGGKTRQESSYAGLLACNPKTELVVIHDAVRPFVSQRILNDNVIAAKRYGAVDTCIPSSDTLVYAPKHTTIQSIPPRHHYLRGQTPQSFHYPLILQAHQQANGLQTTDDCSLVLALGKEVHVVAGEDLNFKITSTLDLALAREMLRQSPAVTTAM